MSGAGEELSNVSPWSSGQGADAFLPSVHGASARAQSAVETGHRARSDAPLCPRTAQAAPGAGQALGQALFGQ